MKINKEMVRAVFWYISFSILGPLLFIGGIGYIMNEIFDNKFILFASIFLAYIVSNVLMFKKLIKINKEFEKIDNDGQGQKEDVIKK